jgi:hypothetical protein
MIKRIVGIHCFAFCLCFKILWFGEPLEILKNVYAVSNYKRLNSILKLTAYAMCT